MIRSATHEDVPWLRELWRGWFQEDPPPWVSLELALALQVEQLERVLDGDVPGIALVAEGAGALLWAAPLDPETLYDMGVYVVPGERARGVGAEMTGLAMDRAKVMGFKRVVISPLESNPKTKAWLEANGFTLHQSTLVKEL